MRMMLESLDYEVLDIAMDFSEAIASLNKQRPDIVLSDIALGSPRDGVDLGRIIKEEFDLPLIFVSSYADKATLDRVKAVKPDGYLVKPFEKEDLYTSIEVAVSKHNSEEIQRELTENQVDQTTIFLKDGHEYINIRLADICYIKSEGNYVEVHTRERRFVTRSTISEFLEKVPQATLVRVHKSYAVNLASISTLKAQEIVINDITIPIGRSYKDDLRSKLNML